MFALKVFVGFKESTKHGEHDYQGEKTLVLVFSKLGGTFLGAQRARSSTESLAGFEERIKRFVGVTTPHEWNFSWRSVKLEFDDSKRRVYAMWCNDLARQVLQEEHEPSGDCEIRLVVPNKSIIPEVRVLSHPGVYNVHVEGTRFKVDKQDFAELDGLASLTSVTNLEVHLLCFHASKLPPDLKLLRVYGCVVGTLALPPSVTFLSFDFCSMKGFAGLGTPQLQFLYVNNHTGLSVFPHELAKAPNLRVLELKGSKMCGTIQKACLMTKLTRLECSDNKLDGSIPMEITRLKDLRWLDLTRNQLTNTVPSDIGSMTLLQGLCLATNRLQGKIPSQLGNLAVLHRLDMANNRLTGSIPTELCTLCVYHLNLAHNLLTGLVPTELGQLPRVLHLDLADNRFTGAIPTELGALTWLTELSLQGNFLMKGVIPTEFGNLVNLFDLCLGNTGLQQTIPTELGNLHKLSKLCLHSNRLTGTVPTELAKLAKLQTLLLRHNCFAKPFPMEVTKRFGDLDDNFFK